MGELAPRREPHSDKPYFRAATYDTNQAALEAYIRTNSVIFSNDCDLESRRLSYENNPYVVVLGLKPRADINRKITTALVGSKEGELPQDIIDALIEQRARARHTFQ